MNMRRLLFSSLLLLSLGMSMGLRAQGQMDPREVAVRKLLQSTMMINQLYVDTVNLERQVEDAITGMLSKLDPHSAYTNAADTKKLNEPLKGNFDGIGVQFNMLDDTLVVIQPVAKGPSEKVGILAGDRIVAVNDTAIAGVKMSREDIMSRLRGPKGTKVRLGVVRRGIKGTLAFTVKRPSWWVSPCWSLYCRRKWYIPYWFDRTTAFVWAMTVLPSPLQKSPSSSTVAPTTGLPLASYTRPENTMPGMVGWMFCDTQRTRLNPLSDSSRLRNEYHAEPVQPKLKRT